MEFAQLRALLGPMISDLKNVITHETIPALCDTLGLPPPNTEGSKRERLMGCFDTMNDTKLPLVAERLLQTHPPEPKIRNQIQELLWASGTDLTLTKRSRRDIARAMESQELFLDSSGFNRLLDRLWVLDDDPMEVWLGKNSNSLRSEIERHVYQNPGDWSVEHLFERLGALEASDRRFVLFLEGLASSDVRPDEPSQRHFVQEVNHVLHTCGAEFREVDLEDGYPIFRIVSLHTGLTSRPKNLIFASSVKPDLRFRDAISNHIEIVTNADKVLVYDRTIGQEGLRWSDLQRWWADTQQIPEEVAAKNSLFRRLASSLPSNSPPQRLLFDAFYRGFGGSIPDLPALLPEVWLHWDPKTVHARGRDALFRFRMDFLMLLPQGVRVVIEVDGKHHYAHPDGRADGIRYAQMAAGDRELQLAGYYVFRFGAQELDENAGPGIVKTFFESMFRRFGVACGHAARP